MNYVRKLTLKTKFLNSIREVFKSRFLERLVVFCLERDIWYTIVSKIIPNNYQYKQRSIRRCKRNGIFYELDISDYLDHIIYFHLKVESKKELFELIRQDDIIIDIGSNNGSTLVEMGKLANKGRAIGFEPVPALFERAKTNIALNNFKNIGIENLAVSDTQGVLFFELSSNNNSGSTYMSKNSIGKMQEINAIRLDDYVENKEMTKLDLIKIDVEGFEHNVIKGALNSLMKFSPKLYIELSDENLRKNGSSPKKLINELLNLGYHIKHSITNQNISKNSDFSLCHFDVICIPSAKEI